MDCPKVEQSRVVLASKIPVRTIRPPSKLPVLISSKENQPKKYPAQSKSYNVKNAVTKSQPNPTSTFLASRANKNLPSQNARPPVSNTVKDNKSHLKKVNPKPKPIENVSSKSQQNSHKAVSAPITGELVISSHNQRPKNKSYSKAFNKDSALQAKTKSSNISYQPTKQPSSKEIFPESGRLTGVASKKQKINLAIPKSSVVDRRLTDITRKNLNLMPNNFETINRNEKFKSVDSTGIKRNTNIGIHARKQSFRPERFMKQNGEKTQDEVFPSDNTPNMFSIDLPEGVNNKTDFSSDVICDDFSNIQIADEKENDENHFLQPDVEFVPDERYRNQILFGQGISPNIKPKQFKSSIVDRPSFFMRQQTALKNLQKQDEDGRRASMLRTSGRPFQTSKCDPIQAVLRALENVDLAAEDRRVSAMKSNPSYRSPHMQRSPKFKQHVDPYKTALKRIEELQMKKKAESTRKVTFSLESSVSNNKASERNEIFDCKKSLTFSNEVIEDDVFEEKENLGSITTPKPKEKNNVIERDVSEEKKNFGSIPTPKPKETTPELQLPASSSYTAGRLERNITQSHYFNMLLRVCDRICSPDKMKSQISDGHEKLDNPTKTDSKVSPSKMGRLKTSEGTGANANRSSESAPEDIRTSLYLQGNQPIQDRRVSALAKNNPSNRQCIQSITSKASSTPTLKPDLRISQSVDPCLRIFSNRLAAPAREDKRYSLYLPKRQPIEPQREDTRYSLYLPRGPQPNLEEQNPRRSTLSKLCTPKPISFFPKPGIKDSISPEFLCRRTYQITAHAPISTPMVLRTMAANLENDSLSPSGFESPSRSDEEDGQVCQRLDFEDELEEKVVCETVRASTDTPFKFNKLSVPGILTNHQILDNMADEECQAISSFTWIPGTAERNFWNPVAQILTHGDDMHFVPLKLK